MGLHLFSSLPFPHCICSADSRCSPGSAPSEEQSGGSSFPQAGYPMQFPCSSADSYSTFQPTKAVHLPKERGKKARSARWKAHLAQRAAPDKSWWRMLKERWQQRDRHPVMLFRVQPHRFWQQTAWFHEPEALFTSLCLTAFRRPFLQRCAQIFLTHSLSQPLHHPMAAGSNFTQSFVEPFFCPLPEHFAWCSFVVLLLLLLFGWFGLVFFTARSSE